MFVIIFFKFLEQKLDKWVSDAGYCQPTSTAMTYRDLPHSTVRSDILQTLIPNSHSASRNPPSTSATARQPLSVYTSFFEFSVAFRVRFVHPAAKPNRQYAKHHFQPIPIINISVKRQICTSFAIAINSYRT